MRGNPPYTRTNENRQEPMATATYEARGPFPVGLSRSLDWMRISSASLGEGTEAQVHRERRLPSPPWLVRSLSLSPPHRLSYTRRPRGEGPPPRSLAPCLRRCRARPPDDLSKHGVHVQGQGGRSASDLSGF